MMTVQRLKRREIKAEEWDRFVDQSPQQCMYAYSWYLDCICPDWQALVAYRNGRWEAVWPLNLDQKWGIEYSLGPYFAQHLGVLYAPPSPSKSRVFQWEKTVLQALIAALPDSLRLLDQNFHPSLQYLLPFHWAGFSIQARYNYCLDLSQGFASIQQGYTRSIQSDLKRAKQEQIRCESSGTIEPLASILQAKGLLKDREGVRLIQLWQAIRERKAGQVFHAVHPDGRLLCAAAFLFDHHRMTYLLSGSQHKQMGANSLLIDHVIRLAQDRPQIQVFDFEGSMLEPVEQYFRGFNPQMSIYFRLRRDDLPWPARYVYRLQKRWRN